MFRVSRLVWLLSLVLAGGCGAPEEAAVTIPTSPDGTVRAVVGGLADNDPRYLWAALPDSYQRDINGLVHQFAASVDREVYDESFALVRKVVHVLKDKRDFILDHPMAGGAFEKEQAAANWDSLVGLLETLVESELSSVDALSSLDVGEWVADTGAEFFSQLSDISRMSKEDFMAPLRAASVELVRNSDGIARVKISAPGKPSEEVDMVEIEGRWLPAEMVEEWADGVAAVRQGLAEMAENKSSAMSARMALGMISTVVDQLDKADTQEDFNKVLNGLFGGMAAPR